MANAQIKAVITAQDNASAVVKNFGDNVDRSGNRLQSFGNKAQAALGGITAIGVTAGLALSKLVDVAGESVEAANKNQAALTGLASVARAFGQSQDTATKAAQSLAKDGLMTVTEAATSLKNLLASGYNLEQATVLMNRFKDSAAFGRQSALGFGQAIMGATEGIKNGNSILVDNAGVTKNLSVILTEAGFSAQDLMRATTDASVRQAIFNGLIKETNPQVGDAAKLTELYAGKQAMLSAQITILQERLGTALQPILLSFLQTVTPIVQKISEWVEAHPKLAATIVVSIGVFAGLLALLSGIVVAVGAVAIAFGATAAAIAAGVVIAMAAVGAFAAAVAVNFGRIREWFNSLPGWARAAADQAGQALLRMMGPLGTIINNIGYLVELFGRLKGAVSGVGDIKGVLHNLKVPGFAGGVQNFGGGLAVVGERGPELVNLPRGSDVIPNHQLGGSSVTANVTISGVFMGTPSEARNLAKMIADNLKDVAGAKNMSVMEYLA